MSPELRFEGIRYRVYRGARLEAHGVAAHAAYRRESATVEADRIEVWFPPASGRELVHATSAQGEGSLRTHDFTAAGGLMLIRAGEVAATESAHYSGAEGMVRGDRPIVVQGPAYTLQGPGFSLDPRTGELTVQGGARLIAGGKERR